MLPLTKNVKLPEQNFPTAWQNVIFRNYGHVLIDRIASVLNCSKEVVLAEAIRLGLTNVSYDENWEKLGYMTIIRDNWFLLPYNQLVNLLGISEQRLEFILQNEDFLGVKLGNFKPCLEEVKYTPLTSEQIKETEGIAKTVEECYLDEYAKKFDFFSSKVNELSDVIVRDGIRMVHGYLTPCGDVFNEDCERYMPDELLREYAKSGINAVWVHAMLSTLSPYPFDESASYGYEKRRKALQKLIDRCVKFGIKVYLYFNEPRGIPVEKLGKYEYLAGRVQNEIACLCFEHKEVQDYLYNSVKDLFSNVKGIGGCFTITMSENPTHCHYVAGNDCPKCKDFAPEEVTAKINNVISKAVKDSGAKAEVIANLWGWSSYMGWKEEQMINGISLLDKDVSVLCVSEFDLDIEKGGVKSRIIDYSISNPGPGEVAKKALTYAKQEGHKIYAKIQINNSWECSSVPYLPTFDLTFEHLKNLSKIGVEDYLLTWTLGGYPSKTMDLISDYSTLKDKFNLDTWYDKTFGKNAKTVHLAVESFCKGFKEYPFSIQNLYLSPKALGYANLWDISKSEKLSTMVCYAYDDYQNWITPYPYEVYVSQYKKLLSAWKEGMEMLSNIADNQLIDEFLTFSKVAYHHFYSDLLQTEYSYAKSIGDTKQMLNVAKIEREQVKDFLRLLKKSPLVGYETSNHYFYSERNVIEKLVNLNKILKTI